MKNKISSYLNKNWRLLATTARFADIPNTELLEHIRTNKISTIRLIWCLFLATIEETAIACLWKLYKRY